MTAAAAAFRGWFSGSLGTVAIVAAVGFWPTMRWGGEQALSALAAGCAAGWLGSLAGALPVLRALRRSDRRAPNVVALSAMAWRAAGTLALGALAFAAGPWPRVPLVVWTGLAYVALLVSETRWTIRWLGAGGR